MSQARGSSLGPVGSGTGKVRSKKELKELKKQKEAAAAAAEAELHLHHQSSKEIPSPNESDREDGSGSSDPDDEKVKKKDPKHIIKSIESRETQHDPSPKYSSSGGLYGNTTMPTTMPQMPSKLGGQTHEDYAEWRPKAKTYCEINSISEVTLESPIRSWEKAVKADAGTHSRIQLLNMWQNLHKKAAAVLRAATEQAMGLSFFNDIEQQQETAGEFDLYSIDPEKPETFSCFILHNSNHLWVKIKEKCGLVTPQHISGLMKRYMSLQYKTTQRPEEFRKEFERTVNDLEQNGCIFPELAHMAIWFNALPPELDALKQGLNARPNLTWQGIFEALQSQYTKKSAGSRSTRGEGELAHIAREKESREQSMATVRCYGCNELGHIRPDCPNRSRDTGGRSRRGGGRGGRGAGRGRARGRGGRPERDMKRRRLDDDDQDFDENRFEHQMALIEQELVAAARERGQPLDSAESVVFVFDSAATSHVTPHEHIIKHLESVPSVVMNTAIKGASVMINKRGTVQLTHEWILKDVALMPKASVSLISEGRIADAGYTIVKTKDDIQIIPPNRSKPLFTGKRVDRLWIITVGGPNPKKRSIAPFARATETDDDEEKEGTGAGAVDTSSSSSSRPKPSSQSSTRKSSRNS